MKSEGTSPVNPRLLFTALLILGVTGSIYLRDRLAWGEARDAWHAREVTELNEAFDAEKSRIESSPADLNSLPMRTQTTGLKLSLIPVGTERLSHLLAEKEKAASGLSERMRFESKSWEGFPTTIRFVRLANHPTFLMMEKVHTPWKPAGGVDERKLIGRNLILLLCALVGAACFILSFFPSRRKVIEVNALTKDEQEVKPVTVSRPLPESLREGAIERSLVEASYRATRLPSFFFRYLPNEGICKLSAEAGLSSASRLHHGGMSFAIDKQILAEIERAESMKERRDLSDQPGLMLLLRNGYGISYFEAWPILETPTFRGLKLLGVLIVTRAHSARVRPSDGTVSGLNLSGMNLTRR